MLGELIYQGKGKPTSQHVIDQEATIEISFSLGGKIRDHEVIEIGTATLMPRGSQVYFMQRRMG
jgi:hypothetical protein